MRRAQKKHQIPDITEFTDEEGKKWVQTSTDDLFSLKELNDILESIDRGMETDEIVLARIDFQKVNREYYDAAVALQKKLKKQSELLKKVINDSKIMIEKKNRKLRELIDYIRKLHVFIAHLNMSDEELEKFTLSPELMARALEGHEKEKEPEYESAFEEVEEEILPLDNGA